MGCGGRERRECTCVHFSSSTCSLALALALSGYGLCPLVITIVPYILVDHHVFTTIPDALGWILTAWVTASLRPLIGLDGRLGATHRLLEKQGALQQAWTA